MQSRNKRAHRILGALKQLHRIEEHKKVELQRRLDELEASQHEVIHALNADDALHGLFVDTAARFLQSLAKEAQHVTVARDVQATRLLENASKLKCAERLTEALNENERRAEQETQLLEVIERYTQDTASPR